MAQKKKPVKATAAKKSAKPKKKISPETAEKIKTGFATLINNDACIKVAREYKHVGWTIGGIVLAIASVCLAVLPSLTQRLAVDYGTSVLGSANYSYDDGLLHLTQKLAEEGVELTIDGEGHPSVDTEAWKSKIAAQGDNVKNVYVYQDYSSSQDKVMFETFVINNCTNAGELSDTDFFSRIAAGKDPSTGSYRADLVVDASADITYTTSYLAIGHDSLVFHRFESTGTDGGTLTGTNADIKNTNFTKFVSEAKDSNGDALQGSSLKTYVTEKYEDVIRKSYNSEKLKSAWSYTGILVAVYAGLIFLFGLLLFLLTRGKKNPFRVYTFWETQKMSYWASFAPAVLSIAVGYMMSTLSVIGFIFLFGMRIMWMSMKSMRPAA